MHGSQYLGSNLKHLNSKTTIGFEGADFGH
jgi:hypothetical protein